jgi:hypothetical protein
MEQREEDGSRHLHLATCGPTSAVRSPNHSRLGTLGIPIGLVALHERRRLDAAVGSVGSGGAHGDGMCCVVDGSDRCDGVEVTRCCMVEVIFL